jgi:Na+/melibiose symporter-like transporter
MGKVSAAIKGAFAKVKAIVQDFLAHWHTPKEGDYVPNKELVKLVAGAGGAAFVDQAAAYISFAATCFLVGSIYKITFRDIYIIGLMELVFSFIYNPLTMIVTDNMGLVPKRTLKGINCYLIPSAVLGLCMLIFFPANWGEVIAPGFFKVVGWIFLYNAFCFYYRLLMFRKLAPRFGKFRSLVVIGWLPCIAVLVFLGWFNFNRIESYAIKLLSLFICFNMYTLFKPFSEQRGNMQNTISPKSEERVKIQTLVTIAAAPIYGIVQTIIPVVAALTGGLTDIKTYRIVYPLFFLMAVPLLLVMAFGVKERVILEKQHVANVNMFNGFKEVVKNKYLWLTNLSDKLNEISAGTINIIQIIFIYQLRQGWLLGLVVTLTGFCQFPSLFLAPALIKKLGKRNTVLVHRACYMLFFVMSWFAVQQANVGLFITGMIVGNLLYCAGDIARQNMNSDIWDYQQYKTGKRLESSAGLIGTLTAPIGKMLAMVVPIVYLSVGFSNDWHMLYEPDALKNVFSVTILLLAAGHIMATVPFFFYDLSEKKHKEIIEELHRRAAALDKEQEEGLLAEAAAARSSPAGVGADGMSIAIDPNIAADIADADTPPADTDREEE